MDQVQFSRSVMSDFVTPWTAARQASLSITNSWSFQTHVHRVRDAIQPSHPLLSPSPPSRLQSFPASGSFSTELALRIRWPKYWSVSISPIDIVTEHKFVFCETSRCQQHTWFLLRPLSIPGRWPSSPCGLT